MPRNEQLGDPTQEDLIEALQHVNEALHRLGGAWQMLPGAVRARLVSESQRIEDLLDRAGALLLPPSLGPRDRRLRHLPLPRPGAPPTKALVLGRGYHRRYKPVAPSDAEGAPAPD